MEGSKAPTASLLSSMESAQNGSAAKEVGAYLQTPVGSKPRFAAFYLSDLMPIILASSDIILASSLSVKWGQ